MSYMDGREFTSSFRKEKAVLYRYSKVHICKNLNKKGTAQSMYIKYFQWCLSNNHTTVSPQWFEVIRRRERIGLRKGDIFEDSDRVLLTQKKAQLLALELHQNHDADNPEIQVLRSEIAELQEREDFACERLKAYREAHLNLESQPKTQIWTVDFFGVQTRMETKFVAFAVVIASKEQLIIPERLRDMVIQPTEPLSIYPEQLVVPERVKKNRRTKAEIVSSGIPGRPETPPSHKKALRQSFVSKLPPVDGPTQASFKPKLTYFHFIVERSKETPVTQTSPYVTWATDILIDSGILEENNCDRKIRFSDGCGKHFKTYAEQYCTALQQSRLRKQGNPCVFEWQFLAPRRGHNRADAAAAHVKVAMDRSIQEFNVLSNVSHIAFACSKLTNTLLIEAKFAEFPEPTAVSLAGGETFMRDCFGVLYGEPKVETIQCNHNCRNKLQCLHPCCKGTPTCLDSKILLIRD